MAQTIKKLAVIGIGMIGGSFCQAVRAHNLCQRIIGYDIDQNSLRIACEKKIIDEAHTDIYKAVSDATLIMFSVPISVMDELLSKLARYPFGSDIVFTDVASVKGPVIEKFSQHLPKQLANFVPAHPIAGTEKNGVLAANKDLFTEHRVILTPTKATCPNAHEWIKKLWTSLGAKVTDLKASYHDEVLSMTSHFPHLLAYMLVDTLVQSPEQKNILKFAAGGFADFTRIASSNPLMWRDISLMNNINILNALELFEQNLQHFKVALENQDGDFLLKKLTDAKNIRDAFIDHRTRSNK